MLALAAARTVSGVAAGFELLELCCDFFAEPPDLPAVLPDLVLDFLDVDVTVAICWTSLLHYEYAGADVTEVLKEDLKC